MFANPELLQTPGAERAGSQRLGNARYANTGTKKAFPAPPPQSAGALSAPKVSASSSRQQPTLLPPQNAKNSPRPAPRTFLTEGAARAAFSRARVVTSLPEAGRAAGAGRGPGRAGSRRPLRRAERLTIYGQSWGRAARGAALPGSARPQRQRAGQGASGPRAPASDRPLRARHARRRLSVPTPGSASARSGWRRGRPGGCRRARRGNKWARMPYEISKRRGPPAPGVGARAAGPLGSGGAWAAQGGARARGRGAGSGRRAPRRPRGRPAGTPARGDPEVGVAGPGAAHPLRPRRAPAGTVDQEVARSAALLQSGGRPSRWRQQVTG